MLDPLADPIPLDASERPRVPRVTNGFLGAFVGFALSDWLSGGLMTLQGLLIPAWVVEGGPERLFVPLFLHGSVFHLLLNCLILVRLGALAERIYGRLRLFVAFLLTGLAGGLLSMHVLPDEAAVLSSGAVLGVVGLLAGYVTFARTDLPEIAVSRLTTALVLAVALEAVFGFVEPFVNNVTHVGGLLAGVLLSLIFQPLIGKPKGNAVRIAAGAALAVGFAVLLSTRPPGLDNTLPGAMARSEDFRQAGNMTESTAVLERNLARRGVGSASQFVTPFAQNQLAWFCVLDGSNIPRGIELSEESNRTLKSEPQFLDTLGYLYAIAGRCRDAADAMGQAAQIDPAYERRRDEVNHACRTGRRPDPDIPVENPIKAIESTPKGSGIRV